MVSVITPVYNGSATIGRACASVAAQSTTDWEHIVIDDGSTDETPEIVAGLAAVEPRLRTVRVSNGGQSAALNRGLDLAWGDFVAFLDADDEFLPDHLGAHVAYLEQHPEIDALYGGAEVVGGNEEDLWIPDVERGSGFLHISECILQGTIFVRGHIAREFRFPADRSIWYQDYVFVKSIAKKHRTALFPHKTYRYYRNLGTSIIDRVKRGWPAE